MVGLFFFNPKLLASIWYKIDIEQGNKRMKIAFSRASETFRTTEMQNTPVFP